MDVQVMQEMLAQFENWGWHHMGNETKEFQMYWELVEALSGDYQTELKIPRG